ncbi:MAG: glycosyltransferase, partial [Thermomicrobium sp.]
VELDRYPLEPPELAEPDHVLFVGSFRYWPNVDGIRWFTEQVWPRIVRCRPAARLSLVGFDPPAEVRRLGKLPGVVVVGTVPDVRPWLARASVVVVPLRAGSGTRLKLLEALAVGKAVVSTRLGAEGVECEHGRHLLLADEPQEFAECVLSLLASPEQRLALGRAGRRLIMEEYAWERIAEKLLTVYRRLASGNGGSGT